MSDQPKRRGRPPKEQAAPVAKTTARVRLLLTAWGALGQKHGAGAELTVSDDVADDWVRHGKAERL